MTTTLKIVNGTKVVVEASGASISAAAVAQANDASLDNSANDVGYPLLRFNFSGAFSVAPTEGKVLSLYRQVLNQEGNSSADAIAPSSTHKDEFIGNFIVANTTSTQYIQLDGIRRSSDAGASESYYISNDADQTLSLGWTLDVTPYTYQQA